MSASWWRVLMTLIRVLAHGALGDLRVPGRYGVDYRHVFLQALLHPARQQCHMELQHRAPR